MLYETGNYSSLVVFENYVCGPKRNFLGEKRRGSLAVRLQPSRASCGRVETLGYPGELCVAVRWYWLACARELKAAYPDRDLRATDDVRRTTMFSAHIHHQQSRLSHILNRITQPFASQA